MKHLIEVKKEIEVHVDPIEGHDFSLVRASWKGEHIKDYLGAKHHEASAFIKNGGLDEKIQKIKHPKDIEKHDIILTSPKGKDYSARICLVKEDVTDYRMIFQKDGLVLSRVMIGEIPTGYKPIYSCRYNHTAFDVKTERPIVNTWADSILESHWKLQELIKFSETVNWLEFADVRFSKTKMDYVRGNGYTAYPTITVDPEVLAEIKEKQSYNRFEALLTHFLGEEGIEKFKNHEKEDEEDEY